MKKIGQTGFSISPIHRRDVDEVSRKVASMDPWLTLGYKQEALAYYLLHADPALKRFCITSEQGIAGVLSVRYPWLFGPFIELLALFDGYRGRGLGRRLIEWTCSQFESSNIWATVSSFNQEAQKFYTRVGFEKTALLDDLIMPGWDEILLRKRTRRADSASR